MKHYIPGVILILVTLFLVPSASAGIQGTSVSLQDLHDRRTFSAAAYEPPLSEGGLSGYWRDSFAISWEINHNLETMLWSYEYTLSAEKKDISHFILEVSPELTRDDIIFSETEDYDDREEEWMHDRSGKDFDDSEDEFDDIEGPREWRKAGNQRLPNSIYGIKFDEGGDLVTYGFTTEADPVWGSFYAKGGSDHHGSVQIMAYNTGLVNRDSYNELDFIARPNGGASPPVVPEPVSSILFLSGGAALAARRYLKRGH